MPGLGDFGERRCAYTWYEGGYADPFSGIVHDIFPGRSFRISHLSWSTMDYENAWLFWSTIFTTFYYRLRYLHND